ncbi:hypothetical protein DFH09DRAFT_1473744 [Mycena vulgaris]|nr:hypothetical protein DFH09DRAFT_1473744 [Mycena vulgaris]
MDPRNGINDPVPDPLLLKELIRCFISTLRTTTASSLAFLFPLDGSPYRDSVKPRDHAVFNRQVLSSARLQFYKSRSTAVPAFSVPGPRTTSSVTRTQAGTATTCPPARPARSPCPARSPFTDITPDTLLAAAPELSGVPQWNSISAGNCRRLAGFILQFKNTPQGLHMKWTTGGFTFSKFNKGHRLKVGRGITYGKHPSCYVVSDVCSEHIPALILLGNIIRGIGASSSSYQALIAGSVINGLGSNFIESCQSKLYSHWFYGNHLGLMYGLDIVFARVINSELAWSIGSGKLSVTAVMAGATGRQYHVHLVPPQASRRIETGEREASREAQGRRKPRTPTKNIVRHTLVDPCGYLDPSYFSCLLHFLLLRTKNVDARTCLAATIGSLHRAYLSITPDLITETRGTSRSDAGYTFSINQSLASASSLNSFLTYHNLQVVSVLCSTATGDGSICDSPAVDPRLLLNELHPGAPHGSVRFPMYLLRAVLTRFHSRAILGSVALSFSAIPFIAAVPLPHLKNISERRLESGKVVLNTAHRWRVRALYHVLDVRYFGGVLRMSEAEKPRDVRRQESEGTDAHAYILKKPVKLWTVLGFGVMCSITVIAFLAAGYKITAGYETARGKLKLQLLLNSGAGEKLLPLVSMKEHE